MVGSGPPNLANAWAIRFPRGRTDSGTARGFPNPGSEAGISGAGAGGFTAVVFSAAAAAIALAVAGEVVKPSGRVLSVWSTSTGVPSSSNLRREGIQ